MNAQDLPSLAAPRGLIYRDRVTKLSLSAYLMLKSVLVSGGRVLLAEVRRTVWDGALVTRCCLQSLTYKVNCKLQRVGCPLRISVDGAFLVLV
jgi:hypothetical protein